MTEIGGRGPTDDEIREVVRRALDRNPAALPTEVQAAWRVHRGMPMGELEAERVFEIYNRDRAQAAYQVHSPEPARAEHESFLGPVLVGAVAAFAGLSLIAGPRGGRPGLFGCHRLPGRIDALDGGPESCSASRRTPNRRLRLLGCRTVHAEAGQPPPTTGNHAIRVIPWPVRRFTEKRPRAATEANPKEESPMMQALSSNDFGSLAGITLHFKGPTTYKLVYLRDDHQ